MSAAGRGDRIFAGDAAMGRVDLASGSVVDDIKPDAVFVWPVRGGQ